MNNPIPKPNTSSSEFVQAEVRGRVGCITLNRPKALNALTLEMVRSLTQALLAWQDDPMVLAVAIRGTAKEGPFGSFCAGGDIRFFHQAALGGDDSLELFFTEEYALNHLIHTYPKPYIAFMDGIVMGGGMGISQGASLRMVTERSKLAMPETGIGLFPDVGGGFFLSRCPGHLGEYLALTGCAINGVEAMAADLADEQMDSGRLVGLWESLGTTPYESGEAVERWCQTYAQKNLDRAQLPLTQINQVFGLGSVAAMFDALEADGSEWGRETLALLRKRSPLMLCVVLEQIRKARGMGLADDLRMERDMVYQCFHLRKGQASETVEGIRALAVDKDHQPRWNPERLEGVTPEMVAAFFESPWTPERHPLREIR
jgi:enoyl-CoA hydratase/carnithine racemase